MATKENVVTREVLDRARCGIPGCTCDQGVVFLHSKCHPMAALQAAYEKATGHVVVQCDECGQEVVRLPIAATDARYLQ